MPLSCNPHQAQPPDFTYQCFEVQRQSLINDFNISYEQAAQQLTHLWHNQNALDKLNWDAQLQEEADEAQQEREQQQQNKAEHQHLQNKEQELNKQEDRKKNCNKFLPYNKTPIVVSVPKVASPLTMHKLKKGDYIELYFWTNKGLTEAKASTHSIDNDAFALTQDTDGHHFFIPIATSKAKESVIPDKDLTWSKFNEVAPHLLQAMKESDWDNDRIHSHLQFWMELGAHDF